MRCEVFLSGTDDRGDWRCTWVDLWSNERPSQRLRWSQSVFDGSLLWWSQSVYDGTLDCRHPA